nr:DDE-type integrase/transposase/recombinase [Cupriavidus taiwanensis]
MEEAINASPRATAQSIYARLVAKIDTANRQRLATEQLKRPALRSVYRMLERVEVYDQVRLREGRISADKRLRLNKTGAKSNSILERVEVDHTPLDLFLIDERTWLPLGRPTLTAVVDHFSRMLLGYHLSFDSPSTAAVMAALRHAILPKVPTTPVLANLTVNHPWPCYGCPDALVVDNGFEFHSKDLESVCLDLGTELFFCPKRQPRFKGVVERYLKTINYFFAHQLPGTSFARFHQRGDYDPQKHAVLTLAEFKHVFEKWVIDIYAQQIHRTLGVTPYHKWEEGLIRRTPGLPVDLLDLQRRIGLTAERALRRDGIWLNGIRYCADELQSLLNAYGEGVRVRVVFDPEDLGRIQVWGPQHDSPIAVLAVDQGYADKLTMRQNELVRSQLRERGISTENKDALERAKYELAKTVEDLMASRRQRHRRQAAAIRGITSSKPLAEVEVVRRTDKAAVAKSRRSESEYEEPPIARYASFRVKR